MRSKLNIEHVHLYVSLIYFMVTLLHISFRRKYVAFRCTRCTSHVATKSFTQNAKIGLTRELVHMYSTCIYHWYFRGQYPRQSRWIRDFDSPPENQSFYCVSVMDGCTWYYWNGYKWPRLLLYSLKNLFLKVCTKI